MTKAPERASGQQQTNLGEDFQSRRDDRSTIYEVALVIGRWVWWCSLAAILLLTWTAAALNQ